MAASLTCSFSKHSSIPCGNSKHYRNIKEYVPLRSCRRDITSHLQRLKTSQANIKGEWQLILLRAGLFDEDGETLTICPLHRDIFGTIWNSSRPVAKCHHPLHGRRRAKPERGISLEISKEIQVYWGVLVPIGSGICELCGLLSFPLSSFFLSFFFFSNTYSFCSLNSRYMHQVQKITFRRKREKRNTNTSGEYILTSKVVPLVTQFFCLFGNLAAKSEL